MPEVRLSLEWPDGVITEIYSPSTVILEHLRPGETLPVAMLQARGLEALRNASERVRARYGFACTRTDEEAAKLERRVAAYQADQLVKIQSQE